MKSRTARDLARRAAELAGEWIPAEVREREAYRVPDAADAIKLDAMENPYGWPDSLIDPWLAELREVRLNRYPDPQARGLKARLREFTGLPADAALLLGNGSDELIQLIALALRASGRVVMAPEPTFVMYRVSALAAGLAYSGIPTQGEDFELPLQELLAAMRRTRPAVVFVAYPNNPTGRLYPEEAVCELIEAAPGLVVVDEAYEPFAGASFASRLGEYPNLLVMRTLSKLGLAGLRLGWLAGPRPWLEELEKLRLPYNVNVLTQASADFALRHFDVLESQSERIRADRERLFAALSELDGIDVWPSRANFLLFRVPKGRGVDVHAGLRERGVLVKLLHGSDPRLEDCLRVTVGTPKENRVFLAALRAVLAEAS